MFRFCPFFPLCSHQAAPHTRTVTGDSAPSGEADSSALTPDPGRRALAVAWRKETTHAVL